jgi:GH15 family glucan-1,4-alpha-glucosidase
MALRIEDYALIGDGESAALVGRDGSIDWLCWPDFASPACSAALLGGPEDGRWRIAPAQRAASRRRYRRDTLIVESDFESDEGAVALVNTAFNLGDRVKPAEERGERDIPPTEEDMPAGAA